MLLYADFEVNIIIIEKTITLCNQSQVTAVACSSPVNNQS